VAVQSRSYTDLDDLATLLQHAGVVVSNAGTILLEALVNDRPAVCVLFDEGAPAGERWADRNLGGDHYKQLADSAAFLRAHEFDELLAGIDRALGRPDELSAERARIAREVVGEVDGKAGERVVSAIVSQLR
jgi:CDP-glycerol glycerophosphotransferase (TagB/SpsB family)